MSRLSARDLMTTAVVTIPPAMPVPAIARLLASRGISAVPVVDDAGAVLGLVSAADLTSRLCATPAAKRSWLGRLLADPVKDAERYARTQGFIAEEVMTTEVVSVTPETDAGAIAATLERKRIRRVLVLEAGRLCGIVSRSDLLRAVSAGTRERRQLPDDRIRAAVLAAMRREPWADAVQTPIEVHAGIVEFHGLSPGRKVIRALRVLAEHVPGVQGVRDRTEAALPYDLVVM